MIKHIVWAGKLPVITVHFKQTHLQTWSKEKNIKYEREMIWKLFIIELWFIVSINISNCIEIPKVFWEFGPDKEILSLKREIILKLLNIELWFLCNVLHLITTYLHFKFYWNTLSTFGVMVSGVYNLRKRDNLKSIHYRVMIFL